MSALEKKNNETGKCEQKEQWQANGRQQIKIGCGKKTI